jgi:hypothetical protein
MSTATTERVFTIYGKVPSSYGWRADYECERAALSDLEAIRRFRHGVKGMRVERIDAGGITVWRKP